MPRIRYIKPSFFIDEKIGALPPVARLFFAGLWCESDREGRLKYSPKELKRKLLSYDRVKVEDLVSLLLERKLVIKYEVEGALYLHIKNFKKHQRPHHTEQPSSFPPPPEKRTVVQPLEHGVTTLGEGNGEGNGEITDGETCAIASAGVLATGAALPSADASEASASPQATGRRVAVQKPGKIPSVAVKATATARAKALSTDINFIVEKRTDGSYDMDGAKFVNITAETIAGWTEAYPAVDVKTEILKARQWLISKWPSSRKTLYRKFLTSWMARTQERGGDRGSNGGYSAGRFNPPPPRSSSPALVLSPVDLERKRRVEAKMGRKAVFTDSQ